MEDLLSPFIPKILACNWLTGEDRILRLDGATPMAKGSKRHIYTLPRRPDLVLKVMRQKNVFKQFRRMFRRSANTTDAYWCRKIHRGIPQCPFVPKVMGFVCTDRGPALVQENICNKDGSPASRPVEIVRSFNRPAAVKQAIEALFQFLADHHVVCNDISEQNILLRTDGRRLQAVAVDGFGDNHLIPYPSLSKRLNRIKLDRKKRRVFEKLNHVVSVTAPSAAAGSRHPSPLKKRSG